MSDPYAGLRDLIDQVPELLQPIIIGLAAMIPFFEGEGAAALGILAGIHPVVAGLSAAIGNIVCVVLVVLLGARIRAAVVARRAARRSDRRLVAAGAGSTASASALSTSTGTGTGTGTGGATAAEGGPDSGSEPKPESKGRQRMKRWLVRFGVPGASLLAPLALPTPFTAAMLVASGVPKAWVILWQVIAIVLWTTLVTLGATGLLAALSAI